jgi:acetyl-CoA carboxylase biotin carboxyl carrier protein
VKRKAKGGKAAPRRVKSGVPSADNSGGARSAGFELAELKRLIRLVQRTGIGELEVSSGGRTVRITATALAAQAPGMTVQMPSSLAPPAAAAAATAADRLVAIPSPMVGTFYRAPAPDADPYVELGSTVEVGQTVCIIEAMKLMNEIESEVKGRIVQILVENSQPVEFGQKLFLIDPV